MAGYLKKIMIIGNVGRDPETRFLQDGAQVTSFSVAVNDRPRRGQSSQGGESGQGGQGGQQEEVTTWFRVTAWRRQAEIVSQYVTKGTSIFVMGNLTAREYVDKDGQKRTSLDIDMQDMQLLTSKGTQEGGGFDEGAPAGGGQSSRPSATYGNRPSGGGQAAGGSRQSPAPSYSDEEDIPF